VLTGSLAQRLVQIVQRSSEPLTEYVLAEMLSTPISDVHAVIEVLVQDGSLRVVSGRRIFTPLETYYHEE
jgi:hypothetical protein